LSDIFREIEEDVRRDRLEKLWKEYGAYFVALIVAILLGVAGWQLWQRYERGQRDKDAVAYNAAMTIADPGQQAKAFADLAAKAGGGYVALSRMGQANALMRGGKQLEAVDLLKDIANSDNGPIGAAARLKAAWSMADRTPRDQLQTLLQPLLDPNGAWRPMAQEVLAYSDYRAGKMLVAASQFNQLANAPQAPDDLRGRARAFADFLNSGGESNSGTVPPPPPPAPPAAAAAPPGPGGAATP
jgi:hypothetical protein